MMDVISAHRRALADALAGLTPEQWHGQSLCAGWTPAHVLAHQTMPFRIPTAEFMSGLQRSGGDFTTFSDQVAARDSTLPPAELISALRDNADTPWSPPGGGLDGALSHDVIHGLDICWPLGIEYDIPSRGLTMVLGSLTSQGDDSLFGVPLAGISVTATDLDWSVGKGAELSGRGRDLVPLLAGRRIPRERFAGAGVSRFWPVTAL
ncbi:MAG TPA: maleylpyruvate isomerase family mycothiol-dependent enzyme [Streptosporangiaceae bacterium]|nr:maleylpyruvate isomerase family mycothiol-dependent enzyme [Streptosporangiaceae bacterium]